METTIAAKATTVFSRKRERDIAIENCVYRTIYITVFGPLIRHAKFSSFVWHFFKRDKIPLCVANLFQQLPLKIEYKRNR